MPFIGRAEAGGVVGDFSGSLDLVTVGFKMFGQGNEIWVVGAEPLAVTIDAEGGRELSGENRGAAGSAFGSGDAGVGEEAFLFGELVDVGSVDLAGVIIVEAACPSAHVVDGQEENVGLGCTKKR